MYINVVHFVFWFVIKEYSLFIYFVNVKQCFDPCCSIKRTLLLSVPHLYEHLCHEDGGEDVVGQFEEDPLLQNKEKTPGLKIRFMLIALMI